MQNLGFSEFQQTSWHLFVNKTGERKVKSAAIIAEDCSDRSIMSYSGIGIV
jgi:hypothetical protein